MENRFILEASVRSFDQDAQPTLVTFSKSNKEGLRIALDLIQKSPDLALIWYKAYEAKEISLLSDIKP